MMFLQNKEKCGFSLAEALITLLIVCLITLASIPILTKKRRSLDNAEHGKWMCTLNSAGQHVYWSKNIGNGDPNNPETWTVAGNHCKFTSPQTARNFAITATAGGGGGAGARNQAKSWSSDFAVEYYGLYKMVAVGGGGGGGKTKCYKKAGGGGAGGVGYLEYNINESVSQIKMSRGTGTCPGDGTYNAGSGLDSRITSVYRKPDGNIAESTLILAKGGNGGQGRWGLENQCRHGDGTGGDQGAVLSDVGAKSYNSHHGKGGSSCGSYYCFGSVMFSATINNFFKPYAPLTNALNYGTDIGRGGQPNRSDGETKFNRCGQDGLVFVMTEIYSSGGGGKAGESVSQRFYPSFDKKSFEVTVGVGGKGGRASQQEDSTDAENGQRGGDTVIGDLFGLRGGEGGRIDYNITAINKTPGGDGDESPLYYKNRPAIGFGGLSDINTDINGRTSVHGYGAGGGGGGVERNSKAGNGADGTPGIVIIEW